MTTTLPPDVFVPVPLRWRHVVAGDVFLGADGRLWCVENMHQGAVCVRNARDQVADRVDPDDVVSVLVPVVERDAVELTREQLGARLIERRTA